MDAGLYYPYSDFLKKKYGTKTYKLPVHLPLTCPNRKDGKGCSYCGEGGSGYESISGPFSVGEQIKMNRAHIQKKIKAEKFIAYFQSYTNTYLPPAEFEKYIFEAAKEDIVEIAVSTRPDCIRKEYLDILQSAKQKNDIEITIELGLQTVNYNSLLKINRGHTLAEFIDAVLTVKNYNFDICVHFILNLPWDTETDVIEGAKLASALQVNHVKLHALCLIKGSRLLEQFSNGEFTPGSKQSYKHRVKQFLCYLSPDISVQRLIGRMPKSFSETANWNESWWKIRDEITAEMQTENIYQGIYFDYLNGKAVTKFFSQP